MKKTKLYLNYAGYCWANENEAIKGGRRLKVKFHALWGIIQHPEKGWILYDTGYTSRFFDETRRFPNKIYALATKVILTPEEEIKAQLIANGISPDEIKHVIITHFHADHIAGLKDFPNATFYTSQKALEHTLKLPRSLAFAKGVLKGLLPADLAERTFIIDKNCTKVSDTHFGYKYDLFGDESIYIYELPGHAAGQIGIRIETINNKYFLIADACWFKKSFEEYVLPSQIVRLFFHSWKEFKQTLKKLQQFHIDNQDVIIVPTHCTETTSPLVQNQINFDVL